MSNNKSPGVTEAFMDRNDLLKSYDFYISLPVGLGRLIAIKLRWDFLTVNEKLGCATGIYDQKNEFCIIFRRRVWSVMQIHAAERWAN